MGGEKVKAQRDKTQSSQYRGVTEVGSLKPSNAPKVCFMNGLRQPEHFSFLY